MENRAKFEKEKYLEKKLIQSGFFKKSFKGITEEEKQYRKEYEISEYRKEEVKEFIEFLIELKEDSSEKLIEDKIRKDGVSKSINHYLYEDLFNKRLDKDLSVFFKKIKNKIKNLNEINDQKMKLSKMFDYNRKKLRNIIRSQKIIKPDFQKDFFYKNYSQKLEDLKDILKNIKIEDEIEYRETHTEAFIQLITHDILHEDISQEKRIFYTEKIVDFLNLLEKTINQKIEINTIQNENIASRDIYEDFYTFLKLKEELIKENESLEIALNLNEFGENIEFSPLNKRINFYEKILDEIEKRSPLTTQTKKNLYISCINYIDLFEIREQVMKENCLMSIFEAEKIANKFKRLSKNKKAKLLYGQDKIKNSFDKINGEIEKILLEYNLYVTSSLQLKKVIISYMENSKELIKPFRKTLKSLLLDTELRKTEIVMKHFRLRMTKGMYLEKEIGEEFVTSHRLQKKINDILLSIYSEKDKKFRIELMKIFVDEFFNFLDETFKNEKVFNISFPKY